MTRPERLRVALIGHPVRHSLSPTLHRAAGRACGIDVDYALVDVEPGRVAAAIEGLRSRGLRGVNITAPHKAEAMAAVDRLAPVAAAIGVVNTLVFGPGAVVGENTDGPGFRAAVADRCPAPRRALVLGAGGAARAVVWALLDLGCAQVDVLNRTPARADALCAASGDARLRPGALSDAGRRLAGCDLLVDTLPGGRAVGLDLPLDAMAPEGRVESLDYGRRAEPLRRFVGLRRPFGDGLAMLAWQGVFAFARWTGVQPPFAPVFDALEVAADPAD